MEFFLPGLLLFLIAILCTYVLAPHVTPIVAAMLSMALLVYGVYDHYHLFASEYRLSTWQETLKIYSPFLMVGAIILYLIFGIMSIFSGAAVPSLPPITNVSIPNVSSTVNRAANQLSSSFSNVGNSLSSMANSALNQASSVGNSLTNYYNRNTNQNTPSMRNNSVENLGERF
jgi:predicted PurR-regulated permease PerM